MFKGKNLLVLLFGIIIGAIIVGRVYFFSQQILGPTRNLSSLPTKQISSPPVASNVKGYIEGSMGFPSETIPIEVLVCAENIEDKKEYCTNERIDDAKYTYHIGYILEVPEGKYLVYEKLPPNEYKAYYSEFVTCGISVDCESHEPIVVEVKKGETTEKVDPQDWYNIPPPTP